MTKSQGQRRKKKQRFERAGTMVLGQARVERVSALSRPLLLRLRVVLLLLLVVTITAGALWLALDDCFYIYHADVVGANRVSPDEVFQVSGLLGLHILWVRPAEIEAHILAALPTLESARVVCRPQLPVSSAGLPVECTITIAERQPMMMWDENGQLWWIDSDGVIFPAQEMLSEGWQVRGPLPRDKDGRLDERVRVALTELWTAGVDVSSSLHYVPGRGLVFTDERGWSVIVGQGPGMAERLQVLECLVADLEARGLTPRFVDVRFFDAPYYSLTND